MKNNNLFLEQHTAFKSGQLEGEAAEQFALQSLRKALIYATNPDVEEDIAYEEFLSQKAQQDHQVKAIARRQRRYAWMGIAASFLLVIGFWQFNTTAQTPQKLWQPLTLDNIKMGAEPEPTAEDKLRQINKLYKNRQYAEALPLYEAFIAENAATNALPYILLAECHAQQKTPDYKKIITYLEKAQQLDTLYRQQDVVWRLGLAYLYDGQKEKAKTTLQKIQKGQYAEKARELWEKM